ncbi:hypothetical protein [Neobacillus cucumis]|uniref:hypothetical protein n=1 Tax=Neobacillus cucumis TaxID=1740721 RepID=UPI00196478F4|nr:hypothetical protein [Neobacillus cucumis]MBM7653597.1 hypothetical protein [Neobacillus cucumis]
MEELVDYSVEIIKDLVYAEINGKPLLADLYLPQLKKEPMPVIIGCMAGDGVSGIAN